MTALPPIDFYCGFHLHQPVGNFGEVFESHIRDVYRPLLAKLASRSAWPVIVHVSGPLFEWCEQYDRRFIDDLARLAAAGRTEFLLAGFYEPVLAALPREDRLQQIAWMREYLRDRFGADDRGLWLTERVWEPDLTRDLSDAGVRYALVDDRHFLVSGHPRATLQRWFRTEHEGRHLDLLPIDERLRYLIPFRPAAEIAAHLRAERAAGSTLAVFADDGEKFGGWPKTLDWVYGSGWIDEFLDTTARMHDDGEIRLVRGADVLAGATNGGLAYLATASYREMEQWSLPPELGVRHLALEQQLGHDIVTGPDGAFIRGAHWKHFLVKYPESNRAHKHMLALSGWCAERGNPPDARRAIGRAQCNDPLWHGVFGGLYLPWLREALWQNLAEAAGRLGTAGSLAIVPRDIDGDGYDELWVRGGSVSAIIAPHRSASVESLLLTALGENAADALTRRVEAYHHAAVDAYRASHQSEPQHGRHTTDDGGTSPSPDANESAAGAPSIHDTEAQNMLAALPPADLDVRSLVQLRVVDADLTEDAWRDARYHARRSLTSERMLVRRADVETDVAKIECAGDALRVDIDVHANGDVRYHAQFLGPLDADARLACEVSLAPRTRVLVDCNGAATAWQMEIESIAKSERGLERTVQGRALHYVMPAGTRQVTVTFRVPDVSSRAARLTDR